MRTALLLPFLLLAACPHPGLVVDLEIPEAVEQVAVGGPLDVLTEAAEALDPSPRGRALGLLIRASAEPAGGEWGPRGLYDPSAWVQRQAVEALSDRLPEAESAALLNELVRREDVDPYVRAGAAVRLAMAGNTESRDDLSAAWKAQREPWTRAPLVAGALAMGDTEALAVLSAALEGGDIALEVDFVLDLGRAGLTDVLPALRAGEKVVEEELALPYAAARVSLGDSAGEGALRRALGSSDVQQRLEALDYLTRLDEPAATALIRKAKGNDNELVRWYAQLSLAARGDTGIDRLAAGMAEDDLEVRLMALRFVGEAGRDGMLSKKDLRTARDVVHLGLAADEPTLREAALRALLDLGLDGEEQFLQDNLGNEYMTVRVAAAGVLLLAGKG